jgi:catechol 2,3-dioxygenase-like lactoylglutathione lyase family enzyme
MLRHIDRIILRVPHLAAAVRYYCDVLGLRLVREDARLALLRFAEGPTEMVLHCDPDLPAEAVYYLVEDVRKLFEQRAELKLQFVQAPAPGARGHRAAIKDPFGNVVLLVDRTGEQGASAIEDAKPPGALFPGLEEKVSLKVEVLVAAYQQVGRTADDLPYTPDFERLYALCTAQCRDSKPTRQEVWRQLLNLRKSSRLPKLGEARSRPPEVDAESLARLAELLGDDMGKRDRLPYTERFDRLVDQFNKTQRRTLSPHLVWRLVATLAK